MHQITDFLQFTCIISTFYESPLKSLLVCKDFTYIISSFYDKRVRSLLVCKVFFFEMTAGNTVEICQKYEIYHEIYNMQLIA